MIGGGGGISMPRQETPAAPKPDDPAVLEAQRQAVIEERRKSRGSTILTGAAGTTTAAPLQQARLLAR